MLRACSISSGSRGNCLFVQSQNSSIIVDAGINLTRLEKSLQLFGTNCNQLDGVLITHTHSDHICGIKALCKSYGVPVYCHGMIASQVGKLTDKTDSVLYEFFDDSFFIKDLTVRPFMVQHDVHCQGFSFVSQTKQISIATDMGRITNTVLDAMQGSDIVFVESNYDTDMLQNGDYPAHLKKRILSSKGHLSNTDCGNLIAQLTNMGTRQFVLSHLSQNNNYPELAFSSVVQGLTLVGIQEGKDCFVEVAEQDRLSSLYQA